jgi:hypothetical protein
MTPSSSKQVKRLRHLSGPSALWGFALLCAMVASLGHHGDAAEDAIGQAVTQAPKISWRMLRGLNFNTGEMTPDLQGLMNARVRVPGYMVPLEDNLEEVSEFLLVPTPGACIHVPPPPPNQIVHVIMDNHEKAKVRFWMEPVWVEGVIKVAEVKSLEGVLSYFQLAGRHILDYMEGR